jgi:hypothetical protein
MIVQRDAPAESVVLLSFMNNPATADMAAVVGALRSVSQEAQNFIIQHTDLSPVPVKQLAALGLNSGDSRVKDLALRVMAGDYRPKTKRYWAASALLLLLEPSDENLKTWCQYHKDTKSDLMLGIVMDALIAKMGATCDIEQDTEILLMQCFAHTYSSRRQSFWNQPFGQAYQAFHIRHDSPFHQKAWNQVFGGKNGIVRKDHIITLVRETPHLLDHQFIWVVDAWKRSKDAQTDVLEMPDPSEVQRIYPGAYIHYADTINFLKIMR